MYPDRGRSGGRRKVRHPPGSPGSHSWSESAGSEFAGGAERPRPVFVHYRVRVIEGFGDSTRNGEWAAVRLFVDGDRIVEADAPGLDRGLVGLTLLEAARVGGDVLATDALANALAPVFRAEPRTGRTAVAMSGTATMNAASTAVLGPKTRRIP